MPLESARKVRLPAPVETGDAGGSQCARIPGERVDVAVGGLQRDTRRFDRAFVDRVAMTAGRGHKGLRRRARIVDEQRVLELHAVADGQVHRAIWRTDGAVVFRERA
jgi:hypothetical protein